MARKFRVSDNKAAIWDGEQDYNPFWDPQNNLGRVKFHSDLDYINIISESSFNVTLPTRNNVQQATQSYPLFQHGRGGYPFVLGKVTVNGQPCAFTGSVPIQREALPPGTSLNGWAPGFCRWISLGADNVWVYVYEYTVAYWSNANFHAYFPQITVPVTVWMTNEILQ
jgi:hypothetical protein